MKVLYVAGVLSVLLATACLADEPITVSGCASRELREDALFSKPPTVEFIISQRQSRAPVSARTDRSRAS